MRFVVQIVENRVQQGDIEMDNIKRMIESEIDQTRSVIEEVQQGLNNALNRKADDRDLESLAKIVQTKAETD